MKISPDVLKQIEAAAVTVTGVNLAAIGEPWGKSFTPELVPQDEATFQQAVIEAAQMRGWKVAHFRKVRVQRKNGQTYWETPVAADGKGFVDLLLVRDRLLFRECKTDKGRMEPEQKEWKEWIEAAGGSHAVWRPRDWNQIIKELT